jgi:hypothetical protein
MTPQNNNTELQELLAEYGRRFRRLWDVDHELAREWAKHVTPDAALVDRIRKANKVGELLTECAEQLNSEFPGYAAEAHRKLLDVQRPLDKLD